MNDLADRYEELREIIDGGSESMTHEDAVTELKRMKDVEDIMLEALRRIVRHQDLVGGSMGKLSATRSIAAKAIEEATK